MGALEDIEQAVRDVAERAGPAVVGIGGRRGQGATGVVVASGQVLTNAHNAYGERVTVTFADGRQATAEVTGSDIDGDVALLAVDTGDVAPPSWADEVPGIGAVVVALANPGGRGLRATVGTVSATGRPFAGPRGRRIAGSIEHTAPLAHGSSGGPLLDRAGHLVGMNTHRLRGGFYLALPADTRLREQVDGLARGDTPRRRRLGVALAPAHVARRLRTAVGLDERDGLLVRGVEEGSPAERAGLRQGDLLVTAGGRALTTADVLHEVLDELAEGGPVTLVVLRGTEELTVEVPLE